ncbi:MAG: type II toxin-antitoxin system RelB/DinJ family antitoxin [Oscillospiraceae bacterium]|nr:type II toxin-antitoxin system RelB/DinJ family antitoxin [Oscillospiraceae bacterium]
MAKSSSVYTRIEPEVKEQAELILSRLGIPMANAIQLYLNQIVLQNGIPFEVKLPRKAPLVYSELSKEEFDAEMEKGMASMRAGRGLSSKEVREKMHRKYGI